MTFKRIAIIVAGGTGTRMNADVPKQFMLLKGRPVLMHSIEKFHAAAAEIIVVLNENLIEKWNKLCLQNKFEIPHLITGGGDTRSASVFNGLNKIADSLTSNEEMVVAIHDAARPMVSIKLITNLFKKASENGNAIPAIKISESLRKVTSQGNTTVNREELVMIQTPQCFHFKELFAAYQSNPKLSFTDDASLFEAEGYKINLIEGEKNNFKITLAEDLKIAEAIF